MLYKTYSLSYPNLFLFSELSCQASLARCWMIDRNWNLFLIWRRRLLIRLCPFAKASPVRLRLVKQRDVIRSGRFEAIPHLPRLGCVICGRKKAVAGSSQAPRSARWGPAAGRGSGGGGSPAPRRRRRAAHASPRGWGLKAGPLAPLGSRRLPPARRRGGGAGRRSTSPPRPPAGRRRPRSCWV